MRRDRKGQRRDDMAYRDHSWENSEKTIEYVGPRIASTAKDNMIYWSLQNSHLLSKRNARLKRMEKNQDVASLVRKEQRTEM